MMKLKEKGRKQKLRVREFRTCSLLRMMRMNLLNNKLNSLLLCKVDSKPPVNNMLVSICIKDMHLVTHIQQTFTMLK